jgi:hypothetical protein
MPVEDAHQPGTKGPPTLKSRQPPPRQQESSLSYIFRERTMMTESQSSGHGDSMMILPQESERLLVTLNRFLNDVIFARYHNLSSLLNMYYAKSRPNGSGKYLTLKTDKNYENLWEFSYRRT